MDADSPFPERMVVYESKNPFTKNLFWRRIETAIKLAELGDRSVILDLGCNTAPLLKRIRRFNSQSECWGVDIEPKILTLNIPNCTFRVGDAKNLPLPNSYFDYVFVLDILEHIEDVDIAIKEIYRVLVSDGHVILSGPTESWFYKLCRFIECGKFNLVGAHFHTIYELEERFASNGFKEEGSRSLPGLLFPTLFRVTKFQKEEQ